MRSTAFYLPLLLLPFLIAVLSGMLVGGVALLAADMIDDRTQRTCQAWADEYGLTDQAVVIACETGEDASGTMSEDDFRSRLDASLNEVKGWIDEDGGL